MDVLQKWFSKNLRMWIFDSRCLVRGNAQEMEDMIPLILALLAIAIVALFLKVSACRDLLLK